MSIIVRQMVLITASLIFHACPVRGQELEVIRIGDGEKQVKQLIEKHNGIPSTIARATLNRNKEIIKAVDLSYSLPYENCHVLISVDAGSRKVTKIDCAIRQDRSSPLEKTPYTIKQLTQFVFSHKQQPRRVSVGDKYSETVALIRQNWKHRPFSVDGFIIANKKVVFERKDGQLISDIVVDGESVGFVDIPHFVSVFEARERAGSKNSDD